MSNDDFADRHQSRMKKKKQRMDAAIEQADKKQGLLLLLTGPGKGKSSSAFGMLARSLGHGLRVAVAQFIKSKTDTGESAFFKKQDGVTWHTLGNGFTWETQNFQEDKETAEKAWSIVQGLLQDESIDVLLLDELTYALSYKWLDTDTILQDIKNRPVMQHVIITGRGAAKALYEAADTVSEIKNVKHAFENGVQAQAGIDL